MRLVHAVREYNAEHDAGLITIALYTDPERQAMFVREADEAYCLGRNAGRGCLGGLGIRSRASRVRRTL